MKGFILYLLSVPFLFAQPPTSTNNCLSGDMYFLSGAPAQFWLCTNPGDPIPWTLIGDNPPSVRISLNGILVGVRGGINFLSGFGTIVILTDSPTSNNVNMQVMLDTAVIKAPRFLTTLPACDNPLRGVITTIQDVSGILADVPYICIAGANQATFNWVKINLSQATIIRR